MIKNSSLQIWITKPLSCCHDVCHQDFIQTYGLLYCNLFAGRKIQKASKHLQLWTDIVNFNVEIWNQIEPLEFHIDMGKREWSENNDK